jgi:hypothetical protein
MSPQILTSLIDPPPHPRIQSSTNTSAPSVAPQARFLPLGLLGKTSSHRPYQAQPEATGGVLGTTDQDLLEEFEKSFQEDFVEFNGGATISGEDKTISPWLQRVGWAKHFSGLDSKVLGSHRGKMPDTEYKLCQAAMKKLFQQSEVLVMSRAIHLMKRIIRSPHTATPLARPFHLDLQDKTRHNYQRVFFDITVYLL